MLLVSYPKYNSFVYIRYILIRLKKPECSVVVPFPGVTLTAVEYYVPLLDNSDVVRFQENHVFIRINNSRPFQVLSIESIRSGSDTFSKIIMLFLISTKCSKRLAWQRVHIIQTDRQIQKVFYNSESSISILISMESIWVYSAGIFYPIFPMCSIPTFNSDIKLMVELNKIIQAERDNNGIREKVH